MKIRAKSGNNETQLFVLATEQQSNGRRAASAQWEWGQHMGHHGPSAIAIASGWFVLSCLLMWAGTLLGWWH
jgi:hypothetical protein